MTPVVSGTVERGDATSALVRDAIGERWAAGTDVLDEMCRYALAVPGKLFRPALLVESARAVGGAADTVLRAAVGTECGHVASLIHDDIIDGDELRRGQTAVHSRYGTDSAIVAGDALIFDLFRCLAECRTSGAADDRIVSAMEIVARAGVELCRGQTLEAEMTKRGALDISSYLRMIRMKTAALFRGACQCGAVLAGAPPDQVAALGGYGENLGMAFQIRDDLLPYCSDAAVAGKPAVSDLRNKRLTLPIILADRLGTRLDRSILDVTLNGGAPDEDAVAAVSAILHRAGAISECERLARDHAESAQRALACLPWTPSRDHLASFAERAADRAS